MFNARKIFRIEIIFFQAKYKNEKFTNKKYVSALSKENIFRENTYTAVLLKIFHLVVRLRTVKTKIKSKMVKTKKNSLHLEVSNDVDLEYETASTTSRRRIIKGKTSTLKKKRTPGLKKRTSVLKKRSVSSKSTKKMDSLNKATKKTLRRPKGKRQLKPSVSKSPKKLMPSMSDKMVTWKDKSEAPQGSKALQSSGTDSKTSESKTIYIRMSVTSSHILLSIVEV